MVAQSSYMHVELFEINKQQLMNVLSSIQGFICDNPYFPQKANELFATDREKLWHLVKLLELEGTVATVHTYNDMLKIVTFSKPKSETYFPFFIDDPDYEIFMYTSEHLKAFDESDYAIIRTLITGAVHSNINEPMKCEGNRVYDTSTDLSENVSEENRKEDLLESIRIYPGFSFMLRIFSGKIYLQILPESHISYSRTVGDLLKQGYNEKDLLTSFWYARILGQRRSFKMLNITDKTVTDVLDEEPFNGRSFEQLARKLYPNLPIITGTPLVRVASSRISYFPVNWARPSLTFKGINILNEHYYSEINGILKSQSEKRPQAAVHWASQISPLNLIGKNVELKPVPLTVYYDPNRLSCSKFDLMKSITSGFIFESPSVTMLRYGEKTEIYPGIEGYQATVNDLMSHSELRPLDAPKKVRLLVFVYSSLMTDWRILKKALSEKRGGYRGFEQTFGTEPVFEKEIETDFNVENFLPEVHALPERGFDCALIVIPRYLKTTEETRRIYATVKTAIMERGIPVQVITDDPKKTLNRDNTLRGKSQNPRVLFGLGINIMAKIGTILCALSDSVTTGLIPTSMILGYNVGRIIPSDTTGIKTIPLSTPLVIFDNKGAYISHQDVYTLKDEISLFEQHGDRIFESLPRDISTLIVHKDGYFYPFELASLREKAKDFGLDFIPVSVRKSAIPRVSNPQYFGPGIGLKAGTVLPLSDDNFLMVTTPIGRWRPEKLGWPNPILITFHDRQDSKLKLKVLYHMYALTKMHTASQRAIRVPISIHYSNMITQFLRKVGDPSPTYIKYFVEKNPEGKYLPRWFL